MSIANSIPLKLSSFLQNHVYHVPEYQRGYSWTEDQIEDFWLDIIQLFEEQDLSSHFLGQIVVHHDRDLGRWFIIDGQQRTSTAVILLDAFRCILESFNATYDFEDARVEAEDITAICIGRITPTRNNERLILGDADKEFFKNVIQRRGTQALRDTDLSSLSNSEKLIYQARIYYEKKLNEVIADISEPEEKLNKLIDLLKLVLERIILMYIETDDINEAFVIFETLNARGKELETSDLLKNHVFRTSNNIDTARENWNRVIENLGNSDTTRFIRHYWNSQHSFVREKDLYKKIRIKVDTPRKVEILLNDLIELSELYASLNYPDANIFFQSSALIERTKETKDLGAISYYPIILALHKKNYSEIDIDRILERLECLIVRNFIVAGKVANKYEIEFAKIAYSITNDEFENTQDVISKISGLTISDEEFMDDFKIFTTNRTAVIRYLLRKIHNKYNNETRIINDNNIIHIEHIMPKKIGEWVVEEEIHKAYLWRFGNLTLLGQEYNRRATNSTFDRKKEIYTNSRIPMTLQLIGFSTWTMEDIENRQANLAEQAVEVWSV